MMNKYVLAIDQGTTSTRAIIFDKDGKIVNSAQKEIHCIYPQAGWVEQDPLEIWSSVNSVIGDVLIKTNLKIDNIDCIGITNQRETTILWDKKTGLPIYNAIVWQSRQSANICQKVSHHKQTIHQKTGLLLNPYFSASKIRFILDATNSQNRAKKGELMFGTVDTWLLYKLTNGLVHATDVTNASRTMIFNIFSKTWDDQLLKIFDIPKAILPAVYESSHMFGQTKLWKKTVPITGIAGDQQAALFGHTCFETGDIKNTYGTGCFMLMNTGDKPVISKHGLLTTIAWAINGQTVYALEGSVFVAGASIQWLRDQLKMINKSEDSERYAKMINDSEGVYVVPSFVGLGTPYWDDDVRGAIFGITRATSRYHIIRATLEAIAYQSKDVIEVMKNEAGLKLKHLSVDGGATGNKYLLQFQADILQVPIQLPNCLETTSLGAAYLAGLKTGYYPDLKTIKKHHDIQQMYAPTMEEIEVVRRYKGWQKAIKATREFTISE
jgi:glycerol kinase